MSRIGRKSITLPAGVTATVTNNIVEVRGPKGQLKVLCLPNITVVVKDGEILVERKSEDKQTRSFHGLIRSLIQNNVLGVTENYKKTLKLVGTGYRAKAQGANVFLAVGYSHPVEVKAVNGVSIKVEGNDTIIIEGIDKQAVGQLAADIRKIRPPEPYKGKGIRYENETVIRKQGKAAA
ncbi:MAG: 50S ribosomal protein L6 [Candidatus Pacebacteria bacterium CG_4_10_14_3_um_filter_34_15]|nr:50S ribosomal protein L6 [Candidatus Pacearchaeota archaeon]NCQ65261.1 50S ribosomal protein L6 [Candidatus Paceibacterota bacterium]OIO45012.1 MAG: 50S ribosomal protein L6 [Candidatus Pacebacteria bacterium CG1_02_43_31]PIQ81040.1 MAG: 50S ribosomal protein L6 [Candidatus Pacebacteria bacterium CG11_big_fil_rev_8_21_14_0_20_34_55]PIX81857.1 MAG: 50S ribosomal protein L6 [Candidatus Pacebacteria bacterium CG_4_10_14_3_um_filter_34_15]PJC44072.1 MAG: 50S ribosomal protein L6 [Candidatus Pac